MKNKKTAVLMSMILILSLVAAFGLRSFMAPCIHEDGSFGSCHWAGEALFGLSLLMAGQAILGLFLARGRREFFLCIFCDAILGVCLPGLLIRLCTMATMRCQSIMKPGVWVLMILMGGFSLTGFFLPGSSQGKERKGKT
ncbi:MAG: DUF4418 family protein [Blautia sp.]|nr:DUF4418 family protein [Blautia sp.]